MPLLALASTEGSRGELNAMQVARGAIDRQGFREEELHNAAQRALDGGARGHRAEADVAAAIDGAAGAALELSGAAGSGPMGAAEG